MTAPTTTRPIQAAAEAAAQAAASAADALILAPYAARGKAPAISKILEAARAAAAAADRTAQAGQAAGATDARSAASVARFKAATERGAQMAREAHAGNDQFNAYAWTAEALISAAQAAGDAGNVLASLAGNSAVWPTAHAATLATMAANEALQCAAGHVARCRILADCKAAGRAAIQAAYQ